MTGEQWFTLVSAIVKQLAMAGGLLFIMMVAFMIYLRKKVQRSIYCEFMDAGESTWALLPMGDDNEVTAPHGIYQLPPVVSMRAKYPPGLPALFQETVPHEKFFRGDSLPMQYEDGAGVHILDHQQMKVLPLVLPQHQGVAVSATEDKQLRNARMAALKVAAEKLERTSREANVLQTWTPWLVLGGVVLGGIGIATFLLMEKLDIINAALRGL